MTNKSDRSMVTLLQNSGLPLSIIMVSFVLMLGGTGGSQLYRYDRDAILAGQVWRLVTGHFVHLGWRHFAMNIAGLILIWLLFGRLISNWRWVICIIVAALFISLGLLVFNYDLKWYVGLSGVLHAMFVCGAIASIIDCYRAEALLLALLVGKLVWEQLYGALPGSASFAGGSVIVDAHLYGAIIGGICASFLIRKKKSLTEPHT